MNKIDASRLKSMEEGKELKDEQILSITQSESSITETSRLVPAETREKIDQELQDDFLWLAVRDTEFLKEMILHVPINYLHPMTGKLISLCYKYFEEFKRAPTDDWPTEFNIFIKSLKDRSEVELYSEYCGGVFPLRNTYPPSREYVISRISHFVKQRKLEEVIRKSADLTTKGKVDEAIELMDELKQELRVKKGERKMKTHNVDEVEIGTEQTEWLWYPVIPKGTLTLLSGAPKVGKGMLCSYLISCLSTGKSFPHIKESIKGHIAILAYEDTVKTMKWRVITMGGKFTNQEVTYFDGIEEGEEEIEFYLDKDIDTLEKFLLTIPNLKLLLIDPLNDFSSIKIDTHMDASVRRVTRPLVKLANKLNLSILAIHHIKKGLGEGETMLDMVMGSRAYTASARSVWVLTKDTNMMLLSCAGSNFVDSQITLPYSVTDYVRPDEQGKSIEFNWHESEQKSADDVKEEKFDKKAPKLKEAIEFIQNFLKNGPVESNDVIEESTKVGISKDTLRRAMKTICKVPYRTKHQGPYFWELLKW